MCSVWPMRKLLISLPDALADRLDAHVKDLGLTRSAYLRQAIYRDLEMQAHERMEAQMRAGYQQMGQLNLNWARFGVQADYEALTRYETALSQSDQSEQTDSLESKQ